jgi:hypothetical protein
MLDHAARNKLQVIYASLNKPLQVHRYHTLWEPDFLSAMDAIEGQVRAEIGGRRSFWRVRWIGGVAVGWLECGFQPAYSVAWQLVVGEP